MAKVASVFVCQQCGAPTSRGTGELDRVLGGGIVPGSVTLVAGEPGIGKSTLLTQLALKVSNASSKFKVQNLKLKAPSVLYVCGEESPSQIKLRIERVGSGNAERGLGDRVLFLPDVDTDAIVATIEKEKPGMGIIDSVQTLRTSDLTSAAGSVSQVTESASRLIDCAKRLSVPMFLVGHVTKEGSIAGPKILEHMVDTVLELTGDRQHELRLLRGIKNRFGPTDETGIFRMTNGGLEEVSDPSKFLLEGRLKGTPGSILALVMEGTRPMTAEIQALVVDSAIPIPRRVAKGVNTNRLQLICAILTKHLRLPLGTKDVFVNITGGLTVNEPGVDLAIALAIISSVKNKALPDSSICFGELGLLGEIRSVAFGDRRLKEAKKLGYKHIYSPSDRKSVV